MNEIGDFLEQHAKVFEECAMSEDHRKYIREMPDSHEKKMLELITS